VLALANTTSDGVQGIEEYLSDLKDQQEDQQIRSKYENTLVFVRGMLGKELS
jgi:hypothetical protein